MIVSLLLLSAFVSVPQDVGVDVLPSAPLMERHRSHLSLHCDFRISNRSAVPVTLVEVSLQEFDSESILIRRRSVNQNGTAPSIQTVVSGPVPPGGTVHIFNPFHHFELEGAPTRLEFIFTLRSAGASLTKTVSFEGTVYETRSLLRLPMDGRLRVWDGHGFLSHHRRLGMDHPVVKSMGLKVNSSRFACDFTVLGPDGAETRGTPVGPEDWYGWGVPVLSPGSGRIAGVVNDFPDNRVAGGRVLQSLLITPKDVVTFAGNHIVIDHRNGEFSVLGHLRKGSILVEVGQEVKAGDPLAALGLSGSTSHVHLHYQVQDSASLSAALGLPCTLARYRLYRGGESVVVLSAPVDTGDIIEHVEGQD